MIIAGFSRYPKSNKSYILVDIDNEEHRTLEILSDPKQKIFFLQSKDNVLYYVKVSKNKKVKVLEYEFVEYELKSSTNKTVSQLSTKLKKSHNHTVYNGNLYSYYTSTEGNIMIQIVLKTGIERHRILTNHRRTSIAHRNTFKWIFFDHYLNYSSSHRKNVENNLRQMIEDNNSYLLNSLNSYLSNTYDSENHQERGLSMSNMNIYSGNTSLEQIYLDRSLNYD